MVFPAGLEPATFGLENRCSVHLSYGNILLLHPVFSDELVKRFAGYTQHTVTPLVPLFLTAYVDNAGTV